MENFLVGWLIHIFCGYRLKYLSIWCLAIWSLHTRGLVYTQYGENIRSFCPPWMGWPQYLDQNHQQIHSIQFF